MPAINQLNSIDISVEKFLNACSQVELREVEILINSPHFQQRMNQADQETETDFHQELLKKRNS